LNSPGIEGEDLACAVLRLESGALITLDMAWCASGEEWALHGTAGGAVYRNLRDLEIMNGAQVTHRQITPPDYGDGGNPLNQHRAFLEAARDGRAAQVTFDTALHDMRVMAAVYRSARTDRRIAV
jgi:predicted dehydrogenase